MGNSSPACCCSRDGLEHDERGSYPSPLPVQSFRALGPNSTDDHHDAINSSRRSAIGIGVSRWIENMTQAEVDYLERTGAVEVFKEMLQTLAKAAPEDPRDVLLDLAVVAGGKLKTKGSEVRPKRKSEVSHLLDTLCTDHALAMQAAKALLAKYGIDLVDQLVLGWDRVMVMMRSLESTWNIDREDSHRMLQLLKRGTFKRSKRKKKAQKQQEDYMRKVASDGDVPLSVSVDNGLPIWLFMELWPCVLKRLHQRYRPSKRQANLRRQEFLRVAEWKSVDENYDVKAEVGSGASGSVALAVHRLSGNIRVLKTIEKSNLTGNVSSTELMREFQLLTELDHPHVVRVFEAFEDNDSVHISMEPVLGGDLRQAIQLNSSWPADLQERWSAEVTRQMLAAVGYAHARGVVHKDLKPQNVLLATASEKTHLHVVICDFGIAEHARNHQPGDAAARFSKWGGTPFYMAPEVWHGNFSCKADLWSIGVILYEMLTYGQLPYRGQNAMLVCRQVTKDEPVDLAPITSQSGRAVCGRLLDKDEDKRPDAEQARLEFAHWLDAAKDESLLKSVRASVQARRASIVFRTKSAPMSLVRCGDDEPEGVETVLTALETLPSRSHMDQCIMACIASQLNATRLDYINSAFERWDKDGSGMLSTEEFTQAMDDLGVQSHVSDVMVRMLDTNGDGEIAYSEFVAGCLDLRRDQVLQHLRVAFSIFDLDKDGYIDREELAKLLLHPVKAAERGREEKQATTAGEESNTDNVSRDDPNNTHEVEASQGHESEEVQEPMQCTNGKRESSLCTTLLPDGATVDEILEELDSSQDGRISFEEFREYLLRNISCMRGTAPTLQRQYASEGF